MDTSQLANAVLAEIGQVFSNCSARTNSFESDPAARLVELIKKHSDKRIVLYGVGREGLMMRAFAMRLYHLGLQAHMVGDMSCPPVASGDLFVASAGPGSFSTVDGLLGVANKAGAATLVITAQPNGASAEKAQYVVHLAAQTMADDMSSAETKQSPVVTGHLEILEQKKGPPLLPMGSIYEGALFVCFEIVVLTLRPRLAESVESMRARHTNLE